MMNVELWRPVDRWAGFYEVSTRGRVRSVARVVVMLNGARRRVPGRLLKLTTPRRPPRRRRPALFTVPTGSEGHLLPHGNRTKSA